MHVLSTPIEYLKGVGPVRSELLKKELRIFTYEDLLFHFPFRYVDKSNIYKISEIAIFGLSCYLVRQVSFF